MLVTGQFRVDTIIMEWKTSQKIYEIFDFILPYYTHEVEEYNCGPIPKTVKNLYEKVNNKIRETFPLKDYSVKIIAIYQCTPFEEIKS